VVASRQAFGVPFLRTSLLRRSGLLALAAFGVHQLRYFAGYGDGAGEALAHHGHGYLEAALPALISLTAAGVVGSLLLSALARRVPAPARSSAGRLSFVAWTAALVVTFTVQELAEGALAAHHPGGFNGVFGHGGWLALPLALVLGLVASIASSGIAAVEHRVAGRLVAARWGAPRCRVPARRPDVVPLACRSLAFGFARRPPPHSAPSL
jgi:hypothetical protein